MAETAPLAGITVLDLTRLLPGPMATRHLADLGAEVIKIEPPGEGDYARGFGPLPPEGGDSYLYTLLNRGKKSLCLDFRRPEDVARFLDLARGADIVVESFRPGVVDRLGVGYAAARAANPRIVYCSITGYGQTGPWRDHAGHDLNYVATAGVLDQIGVAGGPPAIANLPLGDLLGGALTGLAGMLAALVGARVTGQGRYVDIAMTDAVHAHAIFPLLATLAESQPRPRGADDFSGALPCYGVYATADGRYLAVAPIEDKFWHAFCMALERPDLLPHGQARGAEGERTKAELARIFAARPLAHWQKVFAGVDCCVTPVLTVDEARHHPQLVARGMVPADGLTYASPFKFGTIHD